MIAKHIIFKGRVQGVGFRYTAQRIASLSQLTGFVRNLPDGSVEMLAQGPLKDIENCLQDIQESFNDYIRETKINDIPPDPRYTNFQIIF